MIGYSRKMIEQIPQKAAAFLCLCYFKMLMNKVA